MRSYNFPPTPQFDILRQEANQYLAHLGFSKKPSSLSSFHIEGLLKDGNDESYVLKLKKTEKRLCVEIHGSGCRGVAHGFHHLLEMMGFGYSFFADSIPKTFDFKWKGKRNLMVVKPDFKVRGFLPWHNFLNSPTTWNISDWQHYLSTLWRMRVNLLLVHTYDEEPLGAIPDGKGKWLLGKPFQTSWDAPWGGTPKIKTDDYAYGTGKCFKTSKSGVWGASNAFANDPIAQAQTEFAQAVAFGKSLGIETAFGFELRGDPTNIEYPKFLRRRIHHVLQTYPDISTLCLWQSEEWGKRGWVQGEASPGLEQLIDQYGHYFSYFKKAPNRFHEGLRLASLMNMSYRAAKEARPSIRVALSGWGGDFWMHCGEFWKGLHQALPADVVFAALDNIYPRAQDHVSTAIRRVPKKREIWIIPWIESDGAAAFGRNSQWHPQEDLAHFDTLIKSAKRLGYQGMLGIHWQTAGVEMSMAHLAASAWNSKRTPHDFRRDYAQAFFSKKSFIAKQVAKILGQLEALGAGWTGTSQQIECGHFSWEPFPALSEQGLTPGLEKLFQDMRKVRADLRNLSHMDLTAPRRMDGLLIQYFNQHRRKDALQILIQLRSNFKALDIKKPHARRLLATMDFIIAYEAIKRTLAPRGALNRQQELINETVHLGIKPDSRLLYSFEAGIKTVEKLWKEVFHAQINRLDAQGDYGNLVNLNIKGYEAWKIFLKNTLS